MFFRLLLIMLCLALQPVRAQGIWTLTDTKIEVVKDPSYTPAQWIAGTGGVAAEKRWSNPSGDIHSVILASFSWTGIPQQVSEGQEYRVSVQLDQQANNQTGHDPWIKVYSALVGGNEADGPDATASWRQSSCQRKGTGTLTAPKSNGQQMYIRVQCKVAGDYYRVRYFYSLQGHKATPLNLGPVLTVVENGAWKGTWTRRPGTQIFDAVWSHPQGGEIHDVLEIESMQGNRVVLYRRGNQGRYYGQIAPDGHSLQGTMSWNDGGSSWRASW